MKPLKRVLLAAVATCAMIGLPPDLMCTPFSYSGYRIDDLFTKADLVVIGSAEKTRVLREWTIRGAVGMQSVSTLVRVERVYKGTCDGYVQVQFEVQSPVSTGNPGPSLYKGEHSLLFLKSSEDGHYRFADASWGKLDAQGILAGPSSSGVAGLESDLNQSLGIGSPGQTSALKILEAFSHISSTTESTLNELASQTDPDVAARAYSILIATGKPKYIDNVLPFLRSHGNGLGGDELWILGGRIHEFGLKADPQTIAAISNVPIFSIQYVALDVLGQIKSPTTAEAVLHHLDDSNPALQFKSLSVFKRIVDDGGEIGGPEYRPSKTDFDKDPSYYTGLWKTWWRAEGEAKFTHDR
ncbi:MAG TPA: hypothetical protein VGI45_14025 [Terracidiphilus sp.]|jgi:hypothetical protein